MYVAWFRTGQIWEQVPDNFQTNFGQVPDKFCLKLVSERDWIISFYARIFLCMYLGTKPDKFGRKLRSSSGQVPDKFRTSFDFKLVHELSKNQTCPQVVRFYIETCGFCTGRFRVVQKSNMSVSCPPLDNYRTSF